MDATKRCPFCAEQIPEDSVRCPFCQTDLSAVPSDAPLPPAPVPTQRAVGEGALQFSHSGSRYLLGYGPTFFGIWDRSGPRRADPDDGRAIQIVVDGQDIVVQPLIVKA